MTHKNCPTHTRRTSSRAPGHGLRSGALEGSSLTEQLPKANRTDIYRATIVVRASRPFAESASRRASAASAASIFADAAPAGT